MIILDTDHVSLLEWDNEGSAQLRERLADLNPDETATTIISYEEHMRGWMAYIARARPSPSRWKDIRDFEDTWKTTGRSP